MQLPQIINSLLDNDMYKFSMGQCIYHQFSGYKTTWEFKCRNTDVKFTPEMVEEIREQIQAYCSLRFTEDELQYLSSIRWMKETYVDFLRIWQPRFSNFTISTDSDCGLAIEVNGSWLNTSMYEVPVLSIVNEVYFKMSYNYGKLFDSFKTRLNDKLKTISHGGIYCLSNFSEFGTRRRLSFEAQDLVVRELKNAKLSCSTFVGTSNVLLAKTYNLTPVGTMAHELIMCIGQGDHKHNPAYSNYYTLNAWVKEYGTKNGIALTDTIGTDVFLEDFNDDLATLFSGVRHDSGNPISWGEKMIAKYISLCINPMIKTLLFSDSLDFQKADIIMRKFSSRINVAFGIGTYLTNDTFATPLNIVMKVIRCNDMDVAKLSDVEGKGMCRNQDYIDYLKRCIDWRLTHSN